jgi:hypothetical protein
MSDQPPEDMGTIAALVFAAVLVVLVIIGAVLLIGFKARLGRGCGPPLLISGGAHHNTLAMSRAITTASPPQVGWCAPKAGERMRMA